MLTDRQYQCAAFHFESARHYAETKDWEKCIAHSHAAELILSTDETEYKVYRNFCLQSKITKYDWTKEIKRRT